MELYDEQAEIDRWWDDELSGMHDEVWDSEMAADEAELEQDMDEPEDPDEGDEAADAWLEAAYEDRVSGELYDPSDMI